MADDGMDPIRSASVMTEDIHHSQAAINLYPASSNAAMVEELVHAGSLRTLECVKAFRAVDRRSFWIDDPDDYIYADMPVRHGRLHVSAPQIYCEALEALSPITPGMSFLNIGSGTGYFNSIVSELTGNHSTNHGIDIWPEVINHASERCRRLGKQTIQFFNGNVYQLDIDKTTRYDRIYVGACANSRSKYLYRLLEVGGILVGPFQAGRVQQLRRVVRQSETQFCVEVLESVRFASLIEPTVSVPSQLNASPSVSPEPSQILGEGEIGLPGVPFTFALHERPWTRERNQTYPLSFRLVVTVCTQSSSRGWSLCKFPPPEVWEQHIFPWCPRWWFECQRRSLVISPSAPLATSCAADAVEDVQTDDRTSIFEIWGSGQCHAIGTDHDPDDAEHETLPLRVWHLFAERAREEFRATGEDERRRSRSHRPRRRRRRHSR